MTLIIFLESLVLFKLYSLVQFSCVFFWGGGHTSYMPSTVLGTWDIQVNKTDQDSSPC